MIIDKNSAWYSKSKNVLGDIAEINMIKGTVTIIDNDNNLHTVNLDDVIELKGIGEFGDYNIFEHDVFSSLNGELLWEIELVNDDEIVLHRLNERYERIENGTGEKFKKKYLNKLSNHLELVDNIYILKSQLPQIDFNIRIVRERIDERNEKYYYACNNKDVEGIDLIKVVFIGHHLLKEEDYSRETMSYDMYLDLIERGVLEEVKPSDLLNYVNTYNEKTTVNDDEEEILEDDFEDDYDYCLDCGERLDKCDCDLW